MAALIVSVIAVRDSAAGAFARPIFVPSIGIGTRSFADEVNRASDDNQMYRHPEDFELWHIADFDEEKGAFIPVEVRCLARGKDVKQG